MDADTTGDCEALIEADDVEEYGRDIYITTPEADEGEDDAAGAGSGGASWRLKTLASLSVALVLGLAGFAGTASSRRPSVDESSATVALDSSSQAHAMEEKWEEGSSNREASRYLRNMSKEEMLRNLEWHGREVLFDCAAGRENWHKGWSIWKKRWCCTHTDNHFGCLKVLTGSCHIQNVKYSRFEDATRASLRTTFEDTMKAALNKVANTPYGSDDDATTSFVVESELKEYASVIDNIILHFEMKPPADFHLHRLFHRVTAERVTDELQLAVPTVEGIDEVSDENIHISNCMIDMPIEKLRCSCAHGQAVNETCPAQGGEICESCDAGYFLHSQKCKLRKCHCDPSRGFPAEGAICPDDGMKFCARCFQGYHLMRNINTEEVSCEQNYCQCSMGTPVEGVACAEDKAQICASCQPGYHVGESSLCQPNSCYCTNGGAPDEGDPRCKEDGTEACTNRCEEYYHLDEVSGICERNVCQCHGGVPAIGSNGAGCKEHGGEVCADCNGNLFLRADGKCGEKECFCENGIPASGDKCVTHGGNICIDCKLGYKLTREQQCVPDESYSRDQCFCKNGMPTEKEECRREPAEDLDTFDKGDSVLTFAHQQWHECAVQAKDRELGMYKLLCSGGDMGMILVEPWRVTRVVVHECKDCHVGYRLDESSNRCEANGCHCANGTAATGDSCFLDGLEVCSHCNPGYHHVFDNDLVTGRLIVACKPNICRCDHGVPADAVAPPGEPHLICHTHEEEVCKSCTTGYGRNKKHICKYKRCHCPNGAAAEGAVCFKNGEEDCTSCRENFHLFAKDPFMGQRICRDNATLFHKAFDCSLDQTNSFLGWSRLKKHWCCQEENIGCLVSATQEEACTGHRLSERSCNEVGCCEFRADLCLPKDRNEEMCHEGWSTIALPLSQHTEDAARLYPNGLCLSADEPYRNFGRTSARPCNMHNRQMLWSYFQETRQLKNVLGHCASRDKETDPQEVRMVACDSRDPSQVWEFTERTSPTVGEFANYLNDDERCMGTGEDITIGSKVKLESCNSDAKMQHWELSPAAVQRHGTADPADHSRSIEPGAEGEFAEGDGVMADTTGHNDWERGVVQKVNTDDTYMVFVGGFPYNNIPLERLSMADGFHPTWEVEVKESEDLKLDAIVRRRAADGTYEVKFVESGDVKKNVPAENVKQVHVFSLGQDVLVNLHNTWFPAKIEVQQPSGDYTVRLNSDHKVEQHIAESQLTMAVGFPPNTPVWFKDASSGLWDPKWSVVRKNGDGSYELVNHEGEYRDAANSKLLSMLEDSYGPGTEVHVTQSRGPALKATIIRRFSDGTYAVQYEGREEEAYLQASQLSQIGTTTPLPAQVHHVTTTTKGTLHR